MSGSVFGNVFKVVTWGESHGKALGAVIDGCPSRIALNEEDINIWLRRRKPGQNRFSTMRKEADEVEILSGVFKGMTTGTPISLIIYNKDTRSADYDSGVYRPSHADYAYDAKYGIRDFRGGGRSSGRETIGRVAAGAVAAKALADMGVSIKAYVKSIGGICIEKYDENESNPLNMPDKEAYLKASHYLDACMEKGDSVGGVIECVVKGIRAGIGEPVFDKLDAVIAKAVMSIGAVKGIEFGEGFNSALLKGSQNNDPFYADKSGSILKASNRSGGVLGGISDGADIVFKAAVKPTPSIKVPQKTVTAEGENTEITIRGRHDPVITHRAVVVVEAMTAIAVLDLILLARGKNQPFSIN